MVSGEFLYKKRIEAGLSQSQVANKLGYSVQLISLWESGKNTPSIAVLGKYASLLGVGLDGIIYSKDSKNNGHCDDYNFDLNEFSKNLKKLRKQKGLTQKQLAKAISCPTNAIIRFEKATSLPSIEQFLKLADYYNVSIDDLYFAKSFNVLVLPKTKKKIFIPILLPIFITVAVGGGTVGTIAIVTNTSKKQHQDQVINEENNSLVDNISNNDNNSSESIIDNNTNNTNTNNGQNTNSNSGTNTNTNTNTGSSQTVDVKYLYFGSYPQSRVTDEVVINELDQLSTPNALGYYEYLDKQYLKMNAFYNSSYEVDVDLGYFFDNNERIVDGNEYWFKVEPIKWQILEENDNEYFLLSSIVLDSREYDDNSNNYEQSSLRRWLNDDFYNQAFYGVKDKLLSKEIDNSLSSTNLDINSYICNNTFDYVSLLSNKEASNLSYGVELSASTSEYHRANGGGANVYRKAGYWLRSPDNTGSKNVQTVNTIGKIYVRNDVFRSTIGVRPIITIKKFF